MILYVGINLKKNQNLIPGRNLKMLTLDMIYEAKKALSDIARLTPLYPAPKIGENIKIKAENLQLTGSFKLRGAYNKIYSLTQEEKNKGIIACSAGNHAQGVALSATKSGAKSVICMPMGTPISKIEATKGFGSEVVLVPGVYDDAYKKAIELKEKNGYTFAHPFNDELVIAGQGTIGLEILEQEPNVEVVIVPIGGGGLISGVSFAIKSLKPEIKIIGVQAEQAASMYESIKKGYITEIDHVATIADGIAVKKPGDLTFEIISKYVDEIVTVSEDEIALAILSLMEGHKTIAEGAGATSIAAVMFDKVDIKNKNTVCLVSGGNIDVGILSRVITKALTKTGRIIEFGTKVIDKPGQLLNLIKLISDTNANIIKVSHDREDSRSGIDNCMVTMTIETRDKEHVNSVLKLLKENNYELFDI